MKMMMIRTKVRLDRDPSVDFMMRRMSLRDFHDLASLKTLSSLKDLNMESPFTPSASSSTIERTTMTKSKSLALSYNNDNIAMTLLLNLTFLTAKKCLGPIANNLAKDSKANTAVKKRFPSNSRRLRNGDLNN